MENANAVDTVTRISENENLMSAGYIESTGSTALHYRRDDWGREEWLWGSVTQAQCSVTVRDQTANGAAWAGKTSFDIDRVDIEKIAKYALERCRTSLNPVRIEPGRYQVILEPQAVAVFSDILMKSMERDTPEQTGLGPFFLGIDASINRRRTKLDLRVVDERINMFYEPSHPYFGTHVSPLHTRSDFIRNGVLVGLSYHYADNLNELSSIQPVSHATSYQMTGGNTSMEDMISSSKRALLIAKLSQPEIVDQPSLLYSGVTRDGIWLIENGTITKSVRNFKWTESPLFVMNNIEQIGIEEQIFSPNTSRDPLGYIFAESLNNVVVPPLKVNDFSLTASIEAI